MTKTTLISNSLTLEVKLNVIFYALVISLLCANSVNASIIFEEDFETYAAGSSLNGQGGWSNFLAGGVVIDHSSNMGGSLVADGFQNAGGPQSIIGQSINPLSGLTTFTYDAYASLNDPRSHNSGAFLFNSLGLIGWGETNNSAFGAPPRWYFISGGVVEYQPINFAFDEVVHLKTVLDVDAGEVYGFLTTASTTVETSHFVLSQASFDAINSIQMVFDYEQFPARTGLQIDNLQLSSDVPEPSGIMLLSLGLLGGLSFRRMRNK